MLGASRCLCEQQLHLDDELAHPAERTIKQPSGCRGRQRWRTTALIRLLIAIGGERAPGAEPVAQPDTRRGQEVEPQCVRGPRRRISEGVGLFPLLGYILLIVAVALVFRVLVAILRGDSRL